MKTFICIAAGLLAAVFFADGARAMTVSQAGAKPAVGYAAKPVADTATRHRRGSGLFRNWCAYNCTAVPRCHDGHCLGEYGYSRYAYDEDLPAHYRYDRDATPTDNLGALVYPLTVQPITRAFEPIY
jgi:hypothetical protein